MTAPGGASPPALECRALTVSYGSHTVLTGLDLDVASSEAVAVLGPSGCGKTTLLYTVAGFVEPQGGRITIAGRDVAGTGRRSVPPEDRRVGVVFQNYALWPHLRALDIVAYPLRRQRMSRVEAHARAMALLERMGIGGLAHRRPAQLSGGEQQRVGVARALARQAALYLFDEPTAHLDTSTRALLQEELAGQRASLGAAVVYSTHDVAEAFAVADRVALMREGAVVQTGSPHDVYERPVDLWAAQLTGPGSLLELRVAPAGEHTMTAFVGEAAATVDVGAVAAGPEAVARVLVRPEWGRLGGPLPGRVSAVRFRGADTDYRLDTPEGSVEVRERGAPRADVGQATGWSLDRGWLVSEVAPAQPVERILPGTPSRSSSLDPSGPPGR